MYIAIEFFRPGVGFGAPAGHNVFIKDFDFPVGLVSNLADEVEHALFAQGDSFAGPRPVANGEAEDGEALSLMVDWQAKPGELLCR